MSPCSTEEEDTISDGQLSEKMFDGLTAWFSSSVSEKTKTLWGKLYKKELSVYIPNEVNNAASCIMIKLLNIPMIILLLTIIISLTCPQEEEQEEGEYIYTVVIEQIYLSSGLCLQ